MIREARNVLLHLEEFEESETECDARMIAPCPHNGICLQNQFLYLLF